jgi:hypothetical protein
MRPLLIALCFLLVPRLGASVRTNEAVDLLIIVGAEGEKEFGKDFQEARNDWQEAATLAKRRFAVVDAETEGTNHLARIHELMPAQAAGAGDLWIVLIGHGTFDGKEAKFNLAGPDLSAKNLSQMLSLLPRPAVIVNSASSSAPFMNELSKADRIVVTATKSGYEENYTRFGKFFAKAIADAGADIDQDGQVSVLEAFLMASREVEEFYRAEKRLPTEHALLDDNGDGKGTPATFFKGIRPAKEPDEPARVDGFRAHQVHFIQSEAEARLTPEMRKKRDALEVRLEQLRSLKSKMAEAEYFQALEKIALELGRLYRAGEARSP